MESENKEQAMTVMQAVKAYPMACTWAFIMSSTIVSTEATWESHRRPLLTLRLESDYGILLSIPHGILRRPPSVQADVWDSGRLGRICPRECLAVCPASRWTPRSACRSVRRGTHHQPDRISLRYHFGVRLALPFLFWGLKTDLRSDPSLMLLNATIFCMFFANSLPIFFVSQLLEGVPWGIFVSRQRYASFRAIRLCADRGPRP